MAENVTINPVGSLIDATTAQTTINNNFTAIQTALTDVYSLSGVAPNQMENTLDMNSNHILNLPAPSGANEPLRLGDFVPASGFILPSLTGDVTASAANGPLTTTVAEIQGTTVTGTTGTGKVVLQTSPTLVTPVLGVATATSINGVTIPSTTAVALTTSGAVLVATPVDPTGTTSGVGVMMGLGSSCRITPTFSSRVHVVFSGNMVNTTSGDGAEVVMRFGTGTAPVNGVAVTGTVVAPGNGGLAMIAAANNQIVPFNYSGIATGLTPGISYWFDLQLLTITGGTASIHNLGFMAYEV